MRVLIPAIGAALLIVLFVDVFQTVFHASGRGGPINRRQNRILWSAFRAGGLRADGATRAPFLAYGGPTLVATTLVLWVGWLVFAFFLLYLPFASSFLVSPGSLRTPWIEALYYSMYNAGTLGLGDVVADSEALRLLTGFQALSGFALFSLTITYLLAVYGELISARATASEIAGYFAEGTSATLRRLEGAGAEAFARWAEGITSALLRDMEAHFQHPVLNYFHPADRSRALPVQVGRLLEVARELKGQPEGGSLRALRDHPSYRALDRAIGRYLSEIEKHFVPEGFSAPSSDAAADPDERRRLRLVEYLGFGG